MDGILYKRYGKTYFLGMVEAANYEPRYECNESFRSFDFYLGLDAGPPIDVIFTNVQPIPGENEIPVEQVEPVVRPRTRKEIVTQERNDVTTLIKEVRMEGPIFISSKKHHKGFMITSTDIRDHYYLASRMVNRYNDPYSKWFVRCDGPSYGKDARIHILYEGDEV